MKRMTDDDATKVKYRGDSEQKIFETYVIYSS